MTAFQLLRERIADDATVMEREAPWRRAGSMDDSGRSL